jgi:hypothetical protein
MPSRVIESLSDLSAVVQEANRELDGDLWWRGQAVGAWRLLAGVFREGFGVAYEQSATRRFIQRAGSRYAQCPPHADSAAWLMLMQHYGLPTRFLDWSESAMVALYFAVESFDDSPAAIFALAPFELNGVLTGNSWLHSPRHEPAKPLISAAFGNEADIKTIAIALVTDETDARMLAQLTALTLHSSGDALDGLESRERFLRRYDIPAAAKPYLRQELFWHGVRRSTLFPDLANLAAELRGTRFRG